MIDDFRPMRPVKPAPELKQTPQPPKPEPETPFQTPDQVREHDQAALETPLSVELPPEDEAATKSQGNWFRRLKLSWPPGKQEVILFAAVLFMISFGVIGFLQLSKDEAPVITAKTVTKKEPSKPTTVASALSGLQVAPELNQRPVVGVMIENSQAARPQSGLSQAGVVFEAIAEGGITRFLALFQDQQPSNIGPVRSARPYYVQWSEGFRAAYAHVGGSPEALANIKAWGVQDMDQFANSGAFRREPSRSSPHNMYSSVVDLANLATQKGYKSEFTGFERKKATPSAAPTARSIDLSISSALYNAHYDYNAATNSYNRSEGGAVHLDSNTGTQLSPNVVIALVVPLTAGSKTAQGGSYSNYNPLGSGVAYIFQDGTVTQGNWHKASNTAQLTFTDSAGAAVKLNPGQTWISAVAASSKVTYQ